MNTSFLKSTLASIIGSVIVTSVVLTGTALAQTTPAAGQQGGSGGWGAGRGHMMGMMPGIFGTVSAVSGTSFTVTAKMPPTRPGSTGSGSTTVTPTTYTVDASSATVMKNGATSAVSSIAVGDTVMVQGTVSGTSVTAKTIRDGVVPMMGKGPNGGKPGGGPMAQITGNGEPVVGGTVSAVSGNTLTLGTKAGVTYSVDASNATVIKGNATSTVSAIASGDAVVVQGTVQGTSVVASQVLDHGAAPTGANASGSASGQPPHGMGGFLGAIGGFFQHLFGFF